MAAVRVLNYPVFGIRNAENTLIFVRIAGSRIEQKTVGWNRKQRSGVFDDFRQKEIGNVLRGKNHVAAAFPSPFDEAEKIADGDSVL